MKFSKLSILLFLFIFFIIGIFGGTLSQTIYSPFNHIVEKETTQYNSEITKSATKTLVDDRYKDFSEYADDDISEPFCRIGGQYMINVYNDPSPGAAISNNTYKLYYCKTTKDLMNLINIPASWKNNDLVVYCNDGKNVHSLSTNFDYITTLLNTYKACVVRNLDLQENNVIVYGLEVGNKMVDNNPAFFFNHNTSSSPVLIGFSKKNETSQSWNLKKEFGGKALVPFKKTTWEVCTTDSETRQETCITKCKWEARTITEALNWTQTNFDSLAQTMLLNRHHTKSYSPPMVSDGDGGRVVASGSCEAGPGPDSFSEYLYKIDIYYKSTNLDFEYKNGKQFYFDYNTGEKFYAISDFYVNYNEDSIPLLEVFPFGNEIELSRVALFRKQGNKFVYGFETSINLLTRVFGNSVLPTYIVKLEGFSGFTEDKCINSLSSFNVARSTIESNSEVICDGNQVKIISNNLNSKDKNYKSFHLFKNIALSLK